MKLLSLIKVVVDYEVYAQHKSY